jgi:hypothetical protein
MKANLNIEKKIGDVIFSLENEKKREIIEIDKEKEKALVYCSLDGTKEWIELSGANYFTREYKIMNLTEHQNVLIAELSHVEKKYDNNMNCYSHFSLTDAEYFLIPMSNKYAVDFIKNPEENKNVNFTFFFLGKLNMEGNIVDAYYSIDLATVSR